MPHALCFGLLLVTLAEGDEHQTAPCGDGCCTCARPRQHAALLQQAFSYTWSDGCELPVADPDVLASSLLIGLSYTSASSTQVLDQSGRGLPARGQPAPSTPLLDIDDVWEKRLCALAVLTDDGGATRRAWWSGEPS